jgi:hypothetical protein
MATARTHYRLALLLLRPAENRLRERAREAAAHARKALARVPSSPDYRLALAQALMVDEAWDASARELNQLAGDPNWAERAAMERQELVRRRQQVINSVERPVFRPDIATLPWHRPLAVDPVPRPPEPARPSAPPPMRWPPPGSSIAVGRIDYVDCSGPEKIIVMRHPLLRLRFRERKGKPARLFLSPEKSWTEIPCGAKGWNVNIAYYNSQDSNGITGDAVAILF